MSKRAPYQRKIQFLEVHYIPVGFSSLVLSIKHGAANDESLKKEKFKGVCIEVLKGLLGNFPSSSEPPGF